MSPLPPATLATLSDVANAIEEKLQADGYRIAKATGADPAFDESWVECVLLRAAMAHAVSRSGVPCRSLPNGGRELVISEGEVEREFRLRKATRDNHGLRVLASSDSVFTAPRVCTPSLFPDIRPEIIERWVLAVIVDEVTLTLKEAAVARAVGFVHTKPGRLRLIDETGLPLGGPPPPRFVGDDEDLDLPDDGESGEEETG